MIAYFVLSIIPLMLIPLFPGISRNKGQRKWYLILCGIAIVIIIGLRSRTVGSTDSNNYYRMMLRAIMSSSWNEFYNPYGVEEGFQVYVWVLSRVFKDPQWILIASTSIIAVCHLWFIGKYSEDIATSVLLFITLGLLVFEMQAMRQALAMSLCLVAYHHALKRKPIFFLIWIAFATMFHRTAIVFIIVYYLRMFKMNSGSLSLFFLLSILVMFGSTMLIRIANTIFNESYDTAVNSGGFIAVAIYVLIALFAGLFDKDLKCKPEKTNMYYLLLLGGVCYVIRYIGALAAERVSFYFMASQMVVLPNAMIHLEKQQRNVITFFIWILAIMLFLYRLSSSNLVPYAFFI